MNVVENDRKVVVRFHDEHNKEYAGKFEEIDGVRYYMNFFMMCTFDFVNHNVKLWLDDDEGGYGHTAMYTREQFIDEIKNMSREYRYDEYDLFYGIQQEQDDTVIFCTYGDGSGNCGDYVLSRQSFDNMINELNRLVNLI